MVAQPAPTLDVDAIDAFTDDLAAWLDTLNPETFTAQHAQHALSIAGRLTRVAQAFTALMAKRLDDTEAWKLVPGVACSAQLVARELGTTVSHAKQAIDTAAQLEWLPATRTAFIDGTISQAQAAVIVPAALAAPGTEGELVATAGSVPLHKLRDVCNQIEFRANTDDDGQARRRAKTYARGESARDGMWHLDALGPNEQAGEIQAVWDCFTDRAYRNARADGRRDTHDHYAWDGLLAMARAAKSLAERPDIELKPIRPRFIIRIDATLLKAETVGGDGVCEIAGVGPIDVATARRLLPAGMLEFVVAEAVDITAIAHGGRKANIAQLAGLWSRDYVCETRGCEHTRNLQIDHIEEYGRTRRTCVRKLGFKCPHCHDLKTNHGYRDGPLGPDGRRVLIPPPNTS